MQLSPDEKHLYVTIGGKIMRYEVQADDTVANPTEFLDTAGNDGMKVDANGNVFSTTGAVPLVTLVRWMLPEMMK